MPSKTGKRGYPKKQKTHWSDINWGGDGITPGPVGRRHHDGLSCPACGYTNEKKIQICDRCDSPLVKK